jgi:hypothetical protein
MVSFTHRASYVVLWLGLYSFAKGGVKDMTSRLM